MRRTVSERLEDARATLEAMIGELDDISCELPYGSDESEAIHSFSYRLSLLLKAGLPQLPEEEECCEEEEDAAA